MFLVDYKPSLQRKMDREEGRAKGRKEELTQIVKNMLARDMSDEDIIDLTGCPKNFIDELRSQQQKNVK